jgi:anti-sigma B factor antagonist
MGRSPGFSIRIGTDRTARLIGELDLSVYDEATDQLLSAFDGPGDVRLDLSELSFVDSSGIRLLIQLRRALGEGDRIVLSSPTPQVRKILDAVGIRDLGFEVTD